MVEEREGKLKIWDEWNAIEIIARTQTNPQKAVAELVENSIDAHARHVKIIRAKEKRKNYLLVSDDGDGVRLNNKGIPDFEYVETHICDSIKRKYTEAQRMGIQGEFCIGLLGFWCIGHELTMVSKSKNSPTYQMIMIEESRETKASKASKEREHHGVDVYISEMHQSAQRVLTGKKIQRYLATELRGRIKESGVKIVIEDKVSRKKYEVEPKKFGGERIENIQNIPTKGFGDIRAELYVIFPKEGDIATVNIMRRGTRIRKSILEIDELNHDPWVRNKIEGELDYPNFKIAPGTRDGIVPEDDSFQAFLEAVRSIEPQIRKLLEEKEKAKEEKVSKEIMKDVQKAFRDIWSELPEEYSWFEIARRGKITDEERGLGTERGEYHPTSNPNQTPGPLGKVVIRPRLSDVSINNEKRFIAKAYDVNEVPIEENVVFDWKAVGHFGTLVADSSTIAIFKTGSQTGMTTIEVTATQNSITRETSATVIIVPKKKESGRGKGLPTPDFVYEPRESWRSRWKEVRKVIEINKGHRDYRDSKGGRKSLRRYIGKLYAKELVLLNFPTLQKNIILERLIELLTRLEKQL
ncbi:hypothetical protein ES705_21243 [subsurface metagenome]|nr:hypothetical protein [Methanosarcinales archaeon]